MILTGRRGCLLDCIKAGERSGRLKLGGRAKTARSPAACQASGFMALSDISLEAREREHPWAHLGRSQVRKLISPQLAARGSHLGIPRSGPNPLAPPLFL